jgi:hypothetical protein
LKTNHLATLALTLKAVSNRVAIFFLFQTYQNGKWPQNIPNGHKIQQHLPSKGPPKFTQIWTYWFENKPFGNTGLKLYQISEPIEVKWASNFLWM